jgi:hypothetical protein
MKYAIIKAEMAKMAKAQAASNSKHESRSESYGVKLAPAKYSGMRKSMARSKKKKA